MILFKKIKALGKWVWKDKIRFTLTLLTGAALALTLALLFPAFAVSLVSLMTPAFVFAGLAFIVVVPIMLINAGVFICCRACLRWAGENTQASASENLSLAGKAVFYTGFAAAFVGGGFIPVGILGAGALISIGVGAVLAKGVTLLFEGGVALFTYIMERWAQANMAAVNSPFSAPPALLPAPAAAHPSSSQAQALQRLAEASPSSSPPSSRSTSPLLQSRSPSPPPQPQGIPLRPLPPPQPLPQPVDTPAPLYSVQSASHKPAAGLPPPYRHAVTKVSPVSQARQSGDTPPLMIFPPSIFNPGPLQQVVSSAKPPAAPSSVLPTVPAPLPKQSQV